jgi:hypothetical protein
MKIQGKEYKIKVTLRAMMIFEQITGKAFEVKNTMDEMLYFYSILLANNPDCNISFESFINELDDNPKLITEFKDLLLEYTDKMQQFPSPETDSKKKL